MGEGAKCVLTARDTGANNLIEKVGRLCDVRIISGLYDGERISPDAVLHALRGALKPLYDNLLCWRDGVLPQLTLYFRRDELNFVIQELPPELRQIKEPIQVIKTHLVPGH